MSTAVKPALLDECFILDNAVTNMSLHAEQAKREFDKQNIVQGLECLSLVCQYLRTTALSPDLYYELWQHTTETLMQFESIFDDIDAQSTLQGGKRQLSLEVLHEASQYCADIIPRLYLNITVTASLIKTRRVSCKALLFDMSELARGVQLPIHGLFLRNYLSLMTRDKLPDTGTVYAQDEHFHGDVQDAIEFILENFSQMNRLWVRLQHQGPTRERSKRLQERRVLQQLVGTNLYRLSDLNGLTFPLYKDLVLPRILDEIVNCKDVLAQEFLMDCIVQVFTDDYQIGTLDLFLTTLLQLNERVNVATLLTALLQRLGRFGKQLIGGSISLRDSIDAECGLTRLQGFFPLILSTSKNIIVQKNDLMTLRDVIEFCSALLTYISILHNDGLEYIDQVLQIVIDTLRERESEYHKHRYELNEALLQLISAPIEYLHLRFFQLKLIKPLILLLNNSTLRKLAANTCKALLRPVLKQDDSINQDESAPSSSDTTALDAAPNVDNADTKTSSPSSLTSKLPVYISDVSVADSLLSLLRPLIRNDCDEDEKSFQDKDSTSQQNLEPVSYDDDGNIRKDTGNLDAFQQETNFVLVARILYIFDESDLETYFKLLVTFRRYIGQGIPASLTITIPPLITAAFRLARLVYANEQKAAAAAAAAVTSDPDTESSAATAPKPTLRSKKVLHLIHETLQLFVDYDRHTGIRLSVQAAIISDELGLEPIAYEFLVQTFNSCERVSDSKERIQTLAYIMAYLPNMKHLQNDNYQNIAHACYLFAQSFLNKADQARYVANCAHLHWIAPVVPAGEENPEPLPPLTLEDGTPIEQYNAKKVVEFLRKALSQAKNSIGHQATLFIDILNKYVHFYLARCPTTEVDHILGLTQIIIENLQPLVDQGFGRVSVSTAAIAASKQSDNVGIGNTLTGGSASGTQVIYQHRQALLYFKNTVNYMSSREILPQDHPAVLLAQSIERD